MLGDKIYGITWQICIITELKQYDKIRISL